ncbi:TonB-linked outer membrane protein, SusC/RagA family [Pustulibacterium marinum]|uniref:TonB-linked outer membrane protein, SusC/RagA family n=1 Tax=Pustulibacterium marinum TaxID=1224947 RepID=A0A1I7HU59_9FLAO|nr:TonB-dependent receptor [Pustulibacterium marinum]SFU64265.1 TonB-linked outer membrane protein, SusC/RagA family [Pustulibacterium marinum]
MNLQIKYERLLLSCLQRYLLFSLVMFFAGGLCHSAFAQDQEITLTGTVIAEGDKIPLMGASVVEKNTSNGTATDFDGNFTLKVTSANAVLIVSYVGFKTKEVPLDGQTTIQVNLQEDNLLEEVVVVGYGTQKKVNLTGAVGSVDSEVFESRPVQTAADMLQGTIGGLNITSTGGSLENRASINIRGVATIGAGSTGGPLVLIDGMEGDINAINPQDIESVSVLKDAAASSIYGSRAPFGVILITTKKGVKGIPAVNYSNSFRISSPINMPDMMDSYSFALFFNDANINGGASPFFNDEWLQRIQDYQSGQLTATTIVNPNNPQRWMDGYAGGNANVDWYDALYRDSSFSQEHNMSVRGGGEAITYYFSGNYLDQKGLMQFNRDLFKRYTTTIKLDAKLTDWAKVNVSTRFVREDFGRPSALNDGFFQDLARQGWPTLPIYDPNGFMYSSPSPALGIRDGGRDESQKDWLYQQIQLVLNPIEGWEIFGNFNYRTQNDFRHWDVLQTYNHDVDGNPYLYNLNSNVHEYAYRENYFTTNLYTKYSKTFNEKHNAEIMVGMQSELNKYRNITAERAGVIIASSPVLDLTSGTDSNGNIVAPYVAGQYQNWATQGFFGRLNYDYDGKYLLEVNARYDGTSRFRDDLRWKMFPSFSLGWNIANEDFWSNISEDVNMLKLRGSWGELGNQNTQNWYPTYVTMPVGTANGSWLINGAQPNTSNAPGLVSQSMTWERIQSFNLGVDFSAFDNKLTASFDWFNRKTLDMVGPAPELPAILGVGVPDTNNTDLETYGFEFTASWKQRFESGFGYQIQLTLSDSQTKITRYPNLTGDLGTYRQGQMMGEIWGYETIGIAQSDEQMQSHLESLPNGGQDALGNQWAAGDIMYRDLNGDGRIDSGAYTEGDAGDMRKIGNNTPRFPFSFTLSADYKGFDVRAFFQGIMKRDYWQGSYYFWGASSSGIWWSTGFEQHRDYFRPDADHPLGQNLDSYYPRPVFSGKNHQTQTRYLQDASYMRLKNLQIGYTLPSSVTEKLKMTKLRLYVSGENLWTLTNLSEIFDPETIDSGYGGNVYPISRTIAFGLNLNY